MPVSTNINNSDPAQSEPKIKMRMAETAYTISMTNHFFKYFVLPGRFLFSLVFIINGIKHFSQEFINYGASKGVFWPDMLVPASGALAVLGGLSVMFGYKANWGAFMIVSFLIPVTITMHKSGRLMIQWKSNYKVGCS